jgi:putative ABC transport system ATP-binding protein
MEIVVQTQDLMKVYSLAAAEVVALNGATISINKGDFLALMGPSGSGKSTLMHIIAGIDRATSGSCNVLGYDLTKMNETELAI